jgi:hypothetical protein
MNKSDVAIYNQIFLLIDAILIKPYGIIINS